MNIEILLTEQYVKVHNEHMGGLRHGHDLNILKAIIEYCRDKWLVGNLVASLKDKVLENKVRVWMAQ